MHTLTRLLATLILLTGAYSFAQMYSSAEDLVTAMEAQPEPESISSELSMVITSASGQSLSRSMQSWSKNDNSIVKFTGPADIEGSGLLTLDDGENEESYLWLPALGRVRRLSTGGDDQDGAFFGSDFTYEDLDFEISEWEVELLEVNEEDGSFIYQLRATIKDGFSSQYDYVVMHVREDTLLPQSTELYKNGELAKLQSIAEVTLVGDYQLPTALKMENVVTGSYTEIQQSSYVVDGDVPDDVFSERFLQR